MEARGGAIFRISPEANKLLGGLVDQALFLGQVESDPSSTAHAGVVRRGRAGQGRRKASLSGMSPEISRLAGDGILLPESLP